MSSWTLPQVIGFSTLGAEPCRLAEQTIRGWVWDQVSRAVADTTGLRNIMRTTGAVITGSTLLRSLDRTATFIPDRLDIVVPRRAYHTLLTFLVVAFDGVLVEQQSRALTWETIEPTMPNQSTRQLVRTAQGIIAVICSPTDTPLLPIARSGSTLHMNFLSSEAVCIAYPVLLFMRCNMRTEARLSHAAACSLQRDRARGYKLVRGPEHFSRFPRENACYFGGHCATLGRYFGDQFCLYLAFVPLAFAPAVFGTRTGHSILANASTVRTSGDERLSVGWTRGGRGCGDGGSNCDGDIVFAHGVRELVFGNSE